MIRSCSGSYVNISRRSVRCASSARLLIVLSHSMLGSIIIDWPSRMIDTWSVNETRAGSCTQQHEHDCKAGGQPTRSSRSYLRRSRRTPKDRQTGATRRLRRRCLNQALRTPGLWPSHGALIRGQRNVFACPSCEAFSFRVCWRRIFRRGYAPVSGFLVIIGLLNWGCFSAAGCTLAILYSPCITTL